MYVQCHLAGSFLVPAVPGHQQNVGGKESKDYQMIWNTWRHPAYPGSAGLIQNRPRSGVLIVHHKACLDFLFRFIGQ